MSDASSIPVEGTIGPESLEPHVSPEKADKMLLEEWRLYLTDCLKNNFAIKAELSIARSGGTVLWLPPEHRYNHESPVNMRLVGEFAKDCLRGFIRVFRARSLGLA